MSNLKLSLTLIGRSPVAPIIAALSLAIGMGLGIVVCVSVFPDWTGRHWCRDAASCRRSWYLRANSSIAPPGYRASRTDWLASDNQEDWRDVIVGQTFTWGCCAGEPQR